MEPWHTHTNLLDIVSALNHHMYSIKEVAVTYHGQDTWNRDTFELHPDTVHHFLTQHLRPLPGFTIIPNVSISNQQSDQAYYDRHKYDAEMYYFGIGAWIVTLGTALAAKIIYDIGDLTRHILINKHTQQCKILFTVRRENAYPTTQKHVVLRNNTSSLSTLH